METPHFQLYPDTALAPTPTENYAANNRESASPSDSPPEDTDPNRLTGAAYNPEAGNKTDSDGNNSFFFFWYALISNHSHDCIHWKKTNPSADFKEFCEFKIV